MRGNWNRALRPLLILAAVVPALAASWQNAATDAGPTARTGHVMASAGSAGGVYLLGGDGPAGDSLWRFDSGGWRPLPARGPTSRTMAAAAFDTKRGVLVVFGGAGLRNGSRYGETWEWNGQTWAERDVPGPGARDHHAMAYDEARGQVVMYGGWDAERRFPSDTWTWDGAVWTRTLSAGGPGGIGHLAMAYDSRRQRVVLVGGDGPNRPATGDTWEWDGKSWERVATEGPAPRTRHRLAYDAARGVTVMFGGQSGMGPSAIYPTDTWTWDGRAWARIDESGPPPRWVHGMAYDAGRQRVVLYGGGLGARPFNRLADTWEWDGARWQPYASASQGPSAARAVGYYDSALRRVVLVGGPGEARAGARDRAWSWDGSRWESMVPEGPSARVNASAAFDTQRKIGVVTGGARQAATGSTFEVLGDTWEGTQASWQRRVGADLEPRDHHALVYDERRERVIMFGGIPANRSAPWPTDTWELRPVGWTRVATDGPTGRGRTALAYDPVRKQVVMFGGIGASPGPGQSQPFFNDTWVWDAAGWRKVADSGPPGRYAHAMIFDEHAGVVLLFSGAAAHRNAPLSDLWQWDGARWTEIRPEGPTPGHRYQPVMVYDRARSKTVLYGGIQQGATDVTWEWDGRRWTPRP